MMATGDVKRFRGCRRRVALAAAAGLFWMLTGAGSLTQAAVKEGETLLQFTSGGHVLTLE
jgi:hypothetical protein